MNTAIIKLIRFKLAIKNIEAFYCNKIIYDLLKIYSTHFLKNVRLVPNKLENTFRFIDEIEDNDILISCNKNILDNIYPKNKDFDHINKLNETDNLIEHSLFETSFSYENVYFSRLKISSLYITDFLKVFNFFKQNLDLTKLKSFYNFKPLFLDRNLNLVEFGKSDKFIICQNNEDLYENEIYYMKKQYKYAKNIFITSSYIDYLSKDEQILMTDIEQLKPILRKLKFNGIYILGFNYNEVYEYLIKSENIQTLF